MHCMFQLAGQLQQVLQRLALACLQALAGAAPVGTDKPAHAQGDAAIPAADQNDQLVAGKVLNGGEYRPARTAGRFAIVAAAILRSDFPGPAVVRGIRCAVAGDEGPRRCLVGYRSGLGEKAALADLQLEAAGRRQAVAHQTGRAMPQPLRMIWIRLSVARAKSSRVWRLRPVSRQIWLEKSA